MTDFTKVRANLERRGFQVSCFAAAQEAADYLTAKLEGKTIGYGGSMTLKQLGLMERLEGRAALLGHWSGSTRQEAAAAPIYLTSVNGLAETGELINIDGTGNRISAATSAKEAVYYIAGVNKVAETFDKALWRARNVASPLNARRLGRKTPCALKELKCYDCKSPERICRELNVLWRKLNGTENCYVVLIGEEIGY